MARAYVVTVIRGGVRHQWTENYASRADAERAGLDLMGTFHGVVCVRPLVEMTEAEGARRLRLVAARAQQATRLAELMQARSIRSRVRIRTESEVYAELNNLIAAMDAPAGSVMERWKLALVEVATDLDNELVPQPYSETGTEPRGEYDSFTVGVRNGEFAG